MRHVKVCNCKQCREMRGERVERPVYLDFSILAAAGDLARLEEDQAKTAQATRRAIVHFFGGKPR